MEIDNPEHSDFALLRKFLIQTHMQDLKDVTHDVHYENYRLAYPYTNLGHLDITKSLEKDALLRNKYVR